MTDVRKIAVPPDNLDNSLKRFPAMFCKLTLKMKLKLVIRQT